MKSVNFFRKLIMRASVLMGVLLISFTSCETVDELTTFDIEYESSVTIPGTLGLETPLDIPTPAITTNAEEKFSGHDTQKSLIETITLKELTLTIESPSGEDFSFLKDLVLYIDAEDMEETRIASRESISDDVGSTLEMETTSADLKEFIFKDQFNLKATVTTDEMITQDHEIIVHTVFEVDGGLVN